MFEKVLFCSLFSLLIYIVTIILKQLFHKIIPAKYQNLLWTGFFASLIIAILPNNLFYNFDYIHVPNEIVNNLITNSSGVVIENKNIINDLSISLQKLNVENILNFFEGIWLIGIVLLCINIFNSYYKLISKFKKHNKSNLELQTSLEHLNNIVHVHRTVKVFVVNESTSPYSFGIINPHIILPVKFMNSLSEKDINLILLHELIHIKNKDALINMIIYFLKIIYWFNPLVWIVSNKFRFERELLCDSKVLMYMQDDERILYGEVLLNCILLLNNKSPLMVNDFSSFKDKTVYRISNIAQYRNDCLFDKIIIALLVLIILMIAFSQLFFINIYADNDVDFIDNEYKQEVVDLSSAFNDYEGTFVMYDSSIDKYIVYNETLSRTRFAPNSTYKIIDGIMHLEYKNISIYDNFLEWKGVKNYFDVWNENQTLKTALSNSVNWYFQTLDKQIGKKSIFDFLKKIDYGNKNVLSPIDSYWLESSLKIAPLEQVNILRNLDSNLYGFNQNNINYIKESLLIQDTEFFKMYGKTGTGNINGKLVNGWFVGSIQLVDYNLYFATYIKNEDNAGGSTAAKITYDVLQLLKEKGYIKMAL